MSTRVTRALGVGCALLVVSAGSGTAAAQEVRWDRSPEVEERVDGLLGQLTVEEKVDLATGEINNFFGFYNNPIGRLGIPALQLADGPAGVRVANPAVNGGRSTQLPAPIALASTFDAALADRYGDVLGEEAERTNHNGVLGPGVDIQRSPQGARNFESFSEDPLLTSAMGSAVTQGIQRHPVLATAKHYSLNNGETNRFEVDVQADERTIREIYTRPLETLVQDAALASVMCAFNRINGVYACENAQLLTDILKEQIGLRGFVMSDYGATVSTAPSANAGLDQEQPGCPGPAGGDDGGYPDPSACRYGAALLAAVRAGQVSQERLDDMARRILRPMVGLGLFENPTGLRPLPVQRHRRFARALGRQGIVLLKNEDRALPLRGDRRPRSIAVIGADANTIAAFGGGSSAVNPTAAVSPLDGIRRRAGAGVEVDWAPGTDPVSAAALLPGPPPVPSSVLTPEGDPGARGLRAEYWTNPDFAGAPLTVRTEPLAALNLGFYNFGFGAGSPNLPGWPASLNGRMSVRWTGTFTAPADGTYTLSTTSAGSNRVVFDGEVIIDNPGTATQPGEFSQREATLDLEAGEPHTLQIEYAADAEKQNVFTSGAQFRFAWEHPEEVVAPSILEAAELAGERDLAIVVARDYNGEGFEDKPSLDLPYEQDTLIREVAAANPNTIVVLTTGNPVETAEWQDRVPAIVEAWYPGQEQGDAIADVLFGDVNPSGKLPITFPRSEDETPISGGPDQFPGQNDVLRYREGVFVGYRGYDQFGLEPEFPFGHGLSYTRYRYDDLRVTTTAGGRVQVSFRVENTGRRTGSEVAQVYVGRLPTAVPTPPRQLAGWARIRLDPEEGERVTVTLDRKATSYFDAATDRWVTPAGRVPIHIGSSSRDLRLNGTATLR